jgi:hypothetical protein
VFGTDYLGEVTEYASDEKGRQREGNAVTTYLESTGHPLAEVIAQGTVGLPGPFIRMKETTAEPVMRYRLPLLVEDVPHNHWAGWGSPPPGPQTAGTAVVFNRFGKGQCIYIGVPIFWAMEWRAQWIRSWIPWLMRKLVSNPLVELRSDPFSEFVHGSFFHDEAKGAVLVQILDAVQLATKGEMRPTPKVEISIDGTRLHVNTARIVWPEMRDLAIRQENGHLRITIERPDRYTALYLGLG